MLQQIFVAVKHTNAASRSSGIGPWLGVAAIAANERTGERVNKPMRNINNTVLIIISENNDMILQ